MNPFCLSTLASISKILVLALGAFAAWKALTPPHVSDKSERLPLTLAGRYAVSFVPLLKRMHALICLCESAAIIASLLSHTISPSSSTQLSAGHANSYNTPMFMLGSALIISGAHIRMSCYRALGTSFTFELSIRRNHALVTSGPYSFVRHPAYTGLIMTMFGIAITQYEGSFWISQCGWRQTIGVRTYGLFLISSIVLISLGTIKRGWNEDNALRQKFGEAWVKWANVTRYRMIPLVY